MTPDRGEEWTLAPAPTALTPALSEGLSFPRRRAEDGSISDDLEDATDDLIAWLAAHPEELEVYRRAGAWMAYRVALNMATAHFTEPSLHYFALATDFNPSAPDMRVNHAIALHSLGREQEAIEQYEAALPFLDPAADSHVYLLAATLMARNDQRPRAIQILRSLAACPPEEEAFWDLWAELEPPATPASEVQEEAQLSAPTPGKAPTHAEPRSPENRLCDACGASVPAQARFCRYCGAALAAPAVHCPKCGQTVKAGARFCGHCGGPLST